MFINLSKLSVTALELENKSFLVLFFKKEQLPFGLVRLFEVTGQVGGELHTCRVDKTPCAIHQRNVPQPLRLPADARCSARNTRQPALVDGARAYPPYESILV
jgi:hypothetical protein